MWFFLLYCGKREGDNMQEKRERGQYTDEIKEKAYAMLVTNSMRYVSRELNIPVGTLAGWKKERDAKAIEQGTDTIEQLRAKKKEEFVHKAWDLIGDAMDVAQTRIARAKQIENNVDIVADALIKNAKVIEEQAGIGWFALQNLVKDLRETKNFKLSEITTLVGTLYDKQCLATKEPTSIMGGTMTIESIIQKLEGDEY